MFTSLANQRGISLISTMVAVAIGSVVTLGVLSTVGQMMSSQSDIKTKNDVIDFQNAINEVMNNNEWCRLALNGQQFQRNGTRNITMNARVGSQTVQVGPGYQFTPNAVVTGVTVTDKGLVPKIVSIGGTSYRQFMAQIEVAMEGSNPNQAGGRSIQTKYYDLPLIVDGSNRIRFCRGGSVEMADVCQSLGTSWNASTGQCDPQNTCYHGGSYASNGGYGNPLAGGAARCPAGYTAYRSGTFTTTYTFSCGKKSTCTGTRTHPTYQCLNCT